MCHLELSMDAEELAGLEQTEQEMQESRMDPAFANGEFPPQDAEFMHPAAGMQLQTSDKMVLNADTDPSEVPAGWALNQTLGRWIDPDNTETWGKVPRNATCPCNSGKKFKHCHGGVN